MSATIRPAREEDFRAFAEFAASCPPLEAYPLHQYRIVLRCAGGSCLLAEEAGRTVGMVTGLPSRSAPGTWFLWQIGVAPAAQGRGLGRALLDRLEALLREQGFSRVELTVDPENGPSRRLFERAGYVNASARAGTCVEADGCACVRDFYGPGRHFIVFEKALSAPQRPNP